MTTKTKTRPTQYDFRALEAKWRPRWEAAESNDKARSAVGGRPIREMIVVPGRLVNVVTK